MTKLGAIGERRRRRAEALQQACLDVTRRRAREADAIATRRVPKLTVVFDRATP
jgi:hypothetical protein